MGALFSSPGEKIVPSEVFPTSAHVENELLELLYNEMHHVFEYRCTVFSKNAANDPETNTHYWTSETLVEFLLSRHRGKESLIRAAGPLLFRIIMHYGTFPFPVESQAKMACDVFLRGTALLSRHGQINIRRHYHDFTGEYVSRPRQRLDDTRVLFRSMIVDSRKPNSQGRDEDDDRDLLDVMIAIMCRKRLVTQAKWSHTRHQLFSAARSLPSSWSLSTEGAINREELCELVNLLIASNPEDALDEASHHNLETLAQALQNPENQDDLITWQIFRSLMQGTYLPVMEFLCNFVEHTFDQPYASIVGQ